MQVAQHTVEVGHLNVLKGRPTDDQVAGLLEFEYLAGLDALKAQLGRQSSEPNLPLREGTQATVGLADVYASELLGVVPEHQPQRGDAVATAKIQGVGRGQAVCAHPFGDHVGRVVEMSVKPCVFDQVTSPDQRAWRAKALGDALGSVLEVVSKGVQHK